LKLILAGKMVKIDQAFLSKKVLPFIDGKQIKYVGEVGFSKKIELLKNAYALLHPNSVFEACSNTILEAQACGVPVIAFDSGSNKELIINKTTGFIVKDFSSMAKAVKSANTIKRQNCRKNMEENFTVQKMAENYLKLYQKIISAHEK